jgi:hypothetical protein
MADEKELHELSERIGRLELGDQFRLLELILSGYRRRWEERVAEEARATVELLQEIEVLRELERQREAVDCVGAKREAG